MKILNKMTLKSLEANKKRTIVTIIGIALSVALICAITTFVVSFQNTMVEREKITNGDYTLKVSEISEENLNYIKNNLDVENIGIEQEIGYAILEDSKNDYKPYAYVEKFDDYWLNHSGIMLVQGRLPQNENEIVIPEHINTNGGLNLKVGDVISLEIGNRYIDGEKLNQNNPYYTEEDIENQKQNQDIPGTGEGSEVAELKPEYFIPEYTKEYTIVGIMERPNFEDYSAPGYTIITKMENQEANDEVSVGQSSETNVYISLKDPSKTYEFSDYLQDKLEISEYSITVNESLLQYMGIFKSNRMGDFITIMATIVIVIILVTSIFVIYNSFNISLTERTRELGMFSSIGATSTQIRKSIFFEGFLLGIISIPLGIIVGILAIWIVLLFVNGIINSGSTPLIDNFNLKLTVSYSAIGIAILISVIMIVISLLRPSYRAGKITPIDAIRESSDVKIKNKKKNKKEKKYRITKKLFGIEGVIARKNFKRSKKKYRTTIFSIFLSVVLFISMNSFVENTFKLSSLKYDNQEYNISVYKYGENQEREDYFKKIENLEGIKQSIILKTVTLRVDKNYFSELGLKNYGEGASEFTVFLYSLGENGYKKYISDLGLKYDDVKDKGILYDTRINYVYEEGKDGVKREEYDMLNLEEGDSISYIEILEKSEESEVPSQGSIEIAKRTTELPMGSLLKGTYAPVIIISDEMMNNFSYQVSSMLIEAEDADKLQNEIIKIDPLNKQSIFNVEEEARANNNMVLVISIFLYGFIAVITVIGITNIFNTITTNMALRKREFAVLKSIGMTEKEFNRMIRYESFIYGLKALILGLPVGLLLSYFIYIQTGGVYETEYRFPTVPVLLSIVFVFAIIFITMKYSVKKTRKQNIIETIRQENI